MVPLRRALCGVGRAPRSVVLLAALLVVPLEAPLATPLPSSALGAVSGLLRHVGSDVAATVTAPVKKASSASAGSTAVVVLERLLRWLAPVNDSVTASTLMVDLGYPMETHFVTTKDGYRLRLERAPNPGKQPVFVAHGMQTAAPCFVLLGRGKALAPLLHDAGYDVWMINFRGTHYSQEHIKYSKTDEEYWKFSWHEHGVLDNPAAIDYVLARTHFPSVMYASHSMGSTSFMVMAAMRPEYQRKVSAAFLMAPAGSLHGHRSPVVKLLHAVNNATQPLVEDLGLRRTMRPLYLALRRLLKLLLPVARPLLYAFTFAIVGFKKHETYYELPHFADTIPSGGSWGQIFHYEQNANHDTQGIRQYDHGAERNQELYGMPEPPLYNLSAIRTPIHLYLGKNDVLCSERDMDFLRSQLPNVVSVHVDEDDAFNHMDFIASTAVGGRMNARIVADMQRFSAADAEEES